MANFNLNKLIFNSLIPQIRSAAGITIISVVILAIVATIDKGSYIIINTIVTGGMWALMAMGLALLFGVMNVPNFAHGEFFMIGTLVSYYVITPIKDYISNNPNPFYEGVGPLIAIFSAAVIGCLVGIMCELILFRPLRMRSREQWVMNSFLLTLGLSIILVNSHQLLVGTDFKGIVSYWDYSPISIFDTYISFDRCFTFIFALLVMACFWLFMKYSKSGKAVRAVSQDETGSLMVGINLNRIQTITMALSCGLASLAGACLLFMFPSYPTVGVLPLYNSFFVIIVAGMGNVAGAAIGGFIIALFQVLTSVYVGEGWGLIIPLAFIIIILIFKPSGIFSTGVRGILEK